MKMFRYCRNVYDIIECEIAGIAIFGLFRQSLNISAIEENNR